MGKYPIPFFILFSFYSHAQITLRIVKLPDTTPKEANIFFAGNINNWNPAATISVSSKENETIELIIPEGVGALEFKFTLGSWENVECDASGQDIGNRKVAFSGFPQTIEIEIQGWKASNQQEKISTAASNVQLLSADFLIPQLNTKRKIWLYLPPDYYTTTKSYPVIYMQDGQNLFDNLTSFAGEWKVDETLNKLHALGDYGVIVVGIENGGSTRINEYAPFANKEYGGGNGEKYMNFISQTLKPFVDSHYRTMPQPHANALMGSSLGALISTYGAIRFHNQFHKTGSLSPAYWFSLQKFNNYIEQHNAQLENHKIYLSCGQSESKTMVSDLIQIKNALLSKGLLVDNLRINIDPDGTHTEVFWQQEFEKAYLWLFSDLKLKN